MRSSALGRVYRRAEDIEAVNAELDDMYRSIDFNRGLKTWKDYGGGSPGGSAGTP